MTDEQLVEGCVKKQALAQKALYDKYSRRMLGVCLRYASSTDEAQDILQDGFIKVFDKIEAFNAKGSLEGWIRRIMVNTALDNFRKNKKHMNQTDVDDVKYLLKADNFVVESLEAKALLKIIQTLPTGFRTVFNLYAIEGYSHKEIGVMLDVSEGTSKSQYSRARAYIQKILEKENITSR
ncbi:MAG: RNA polymerase sigma factor [Bacteroidetes bacterium]|nr:RNA polymerase sigma factor [Bacteroidota bacterium]MCL4817452.1 RNA polymerase sigma factor [Flavobacteriales bacterium]WKZ75777.1 MAG: RNA polymerase sigma factor [Vicingaceae bacterium]NOG96228.1 RNA polymerase sigma factor [Bacteroidota bacterium]CAG0994076.1 RNA polymerase sigma-H factor [Flavobacteriales bacterium]